MHGQFLRNLDEKLVDIEQSYSWLKSGDIKGDTESTILAAQDQAISTNYFKNKILKQEIQSKCRLCKQHEETIDHLTSGCSILAKNEYLMRYDKVCTHLHYSICKALGIETTDKWYTQMPKPVCEEGDVTVLWNEAVHTDREVTANRTDITIKNKKKENMHTDRCGNTHRKKCCAKGSRIEVKIQDYTRKTLDRFTTKDSYTWNITHKTESTAM